MHEPYLQKGWPYRKKTTIVLEANTRGRGTVSLRICHKAKQGAKEHVRIGFPIITSRVYVFGQVVETPVSYCVIYDVPESAGTSWRSCSNKKHPANTIIRGVT